MENFSKKSLSLRQAHPIPPVFDENSKILILGSFPSVMSRENGFFYGNPQNRFWKVISTVFDQNLPQSVAEKKDFLLKNNIALWDVIASCDIENSSDISIKNVTANDINSLLTKTKITRVFLNGKAANNYYKKYVLNLVSIPSTVLPSTSPANAAFSVDRLIAEWKVICA
ncbi:MAG: DNA-deoxyinosine glycosylase [Clostridia bacterium]